MTRHYREPPIDTVLRHLLRASDVAKKRRVVVRVRRAISLAIEDTFDEGRRQRAKGLRK